VPARESQQSLPLGAGLNNQPSARDSQAMIASRLAHANTVSAMATSELVVVLNLLGRQSHRMAPDSHHPPANFGNLCLGLLLRRKPVVDEGPTSLKHDE